MDDGFDDLMDISDSDDDEIKDATYESLTIYDIMCKMEQKIEEVVASTKLPVTVVRIAFSQYDWKKWDLLEVYFDCPEKFFKKINVKAPVEGEQAFNKVSVASSGQITSTNPSTRECLTCYEELPLNSMVSLSCGHPFCKDCWSQYLTIKINEGAELISCQVSKCDIIVDDMTVIQLVTDEKVKARHNRWIANSFVLNHKLLKWCPGVDCNYVVEASVPPIHRLDCTCKSGHEFCFECLNPPHEPVPCYLYKIWLEHSTDANFIYMSKNTKSCPKCSCVIEKNEGCDYMYCPRCRTEFCWVCFKKCFANWRYGHGFCNTPIDERPPPHQNSIRYQRYSECFNKHKALFESEKKFIPNRIVNEAAIPGRLGLLQADVKLLQKSVDTLLACRKSLMMSYVFGYSVFEGNQKTIFEGNQQDLEDAVKILSNYLEMNETYTEFAEMNIKIRDKTEYCEQRRMKLIDHISEGFEKNWWSANISTEQPTD